MPEYVPHPRVVGRVREFLLLREAEQTVRAYTDEQGTTLRRLHAAGEKRLFAARQLGTALTRVAECILLREALRCFLRARDVAAGVWAPTAVADLGALSGELRGLLDSKEMYFDEMSQPSLDASRARLFDAIDVLRASVEVRSPERVRGTRVGRIAGLGILVVWMLWSVVGAMLRPTNVARGKPVTTSSRFPGTIDPSGVVDGDTAGTFGVHTLREPSAWVTIDLERKYFLRKIKVYNRGDGWFDEGLPLVVEVSEDGTQWTEVGRRATHFDQSPPWELDAAGRPGRYVRLRVDSKNGIVALSEVEVFGKK